MLELQIKDDKIFAPLKDKWLIATPEEKVRQKTICKLVNHYGYSLNQMSQELQVSNSQRGQGKARADIVIWKSAKEKQENKNAFIVVECKAENITVKEEDYFQGLNYATWAKATFFITTNEKNIKFFKVNKETIPDELDEILDIPKAEDADNQVKINKILSQTKTFTRDEFTTLLQKCHNIIRNNDKLSPEAAFDEISKILFMKIRYERNPDEEAIFSKEHFEKKEKDYEKNIKPNLVSEADKVPYMQFLFRQTKKEFANDDLFDENDAIKIRQHSFEQIVKELEKYNLSESSDDIKGIAFEKFLGRTFRGELGQFFTPRPLVDFMVETLDPEEGEIICDPCCGSGGFLIKAFEYVREKIESDIHQQKSKIKETYFEKDFDKLSENQKESLVKKVNKLIAELNKDLDLKNTDGRLNNLSANSIFGTDANPRMARTSKMNMIMHGDGHSGLHHNDGLLNVNGIFENRFDVILTNPPFGARVGKEIKISESDINKDYKIIIEYKNRYKEQYKEQYIEELKKNNTISKKSLNLLEKFREEYFLSIKNLNDYLNKPILDLFDVGKFSGLTEVLFMERCLKLLKKGGRMGIVLPEGVLNNPNLQKIREYFEGRAKIILIVSIPQDVFISAKATVKPSLVFLKKFSEDEEKEFEKTKKQSEKQAKENYQQELESIENLDLSKKEKANKIKEIESKIADDIKKLIKEKFNYQIPIAEVKQAGISTTGDICKNELVDVVKEFKQFRQKNNIWQNPSKVEFSYLLANDGIKKLKNGDDE